jgi:hypothetical protein
MMVKSKSLRVFLVLWIQNKMRMPPYLQNEVFMFMRMHSYESFDGLGFGHVSGVVRRFRFWYFIRCVCIHTNKRLTMTFETIRNRNRNVLKRYQKNAMLFD